MYLQTKWSFSLFISSFARDVLFMCFRSQLEIYKKKCWQIFFFFFEDNNHFLNVYSRGGEGSKMQPMTQVVEDKFNS